MPFKKTLVEKLFNISKISSQAVTNCRISSSTVHNRVSQNAGKANTGNGNDNGVSRRFFQRGTPVWPAMRTLPAGKDLLERLKEIDMLKDRIRFDGLSPVLAEKPAGVSLSVEEVKKLFKVAQLEVLKTRLIGMGKIWIAYSDFIRICGESCSDHEQALQFAKLLDESGNVVVLGNVVVIRPDWVAKALRGVILLPEPGPNDPRKKELMELEKQKALIDSEADSLVRRELWVGLAYMFVQTAVFMRLTFWELTWDVMEPICFFVTSMYFMAGYSFFLRTSKEPSFEGFYQSRFSAKQTKLMKANEFDIHRYNELKQLFYPNSSSSEQDYKMTSFDPSEKTQIGTLDH